MKKLLIALSIILSLSLVFVACNGKKEEATTTPDTTAEVTEDTTAHTSEKETADTTAEITTEPDTSAPESTAEETSLETTGSNESSAPETTAEVTTEEETTVDETLVSAEKVNSILAEVDKSMGEITKFKKTTTTQSSTSEGIIGFQSISSVHFDGLYAHVSDGVGDMYFIDDAINIISCYECEDVYNVVALVSESEKAYFLDTYVTYTNEFGTATEVFEKFNLTYGENGEYVILCSSPKEEFIAGIVEGSQTVDDFCIKIVINEDYPLAGYETVMTVSADMDGTPISFTSLEACEYDYNVDFVEPPTERFDGYTMIEFEDHFGYIDTSYGADLGLDIESDTYVLDYANSERVLKQLNFISDFNDSFIGKTFTAYGIIEEDEGVYCLCLPEGELIFELSLADGITVNVGDLVCLTGTYLQNGEESYFASYLEVSDCDVITESEIPEGGYLPWTAFVTAKTLNVRSSADFTADNKVGVINQNTEVKVVGFIPDRYCMIEYHWETADGQSGEYAYVSLAYLSKLPTYYISIDENFKPTNPPV